MAPNGSGMSQTLSNQAVSLQKTEVSVALISVVEFPPVEQTKWNPKAQNQHSAIEVANI